MAKFDRAASERLPPMSSFSWKGEEKVTWHGMEVRRLNGPSMNVDITNDYEAAAAAAPEQGLMELATRGETERVVELLQEGECFVNETDPFGNTPLWLAAFAGKPETVKALLGCRANPDLPNDYGRVPLHAACHRGDHEACARFLLDAHADINMRNGIDQTPLDLAKAQGRAGITAVLNEVAHQGAKRESWVSPMEERIASIDPLTTRLLPPLTPCRPKKS